MKLLVNYYKRKVLNIICGSELTNTKIHNLIALHFIESIRKKSIIGSSDTNFLYYDTMYTVYLPEVLYTRIKRELIAIVQATAHECECILKNKVNPHKYINYNTPHSPYWQFLFQPVPIGGIIPGSNHMVTDNTFFIASETFPEGRDKDTKDQDNKVRVSIRSKRSTGMNETYFNKDAFNGVTPVSEGEFVVPFGKISSTRVVPNRQSVLLTLSINNAKFLVDGEKTSTYHLACSEIYIAGKNANNTYNGVPVLRIADSHIWNPHLHIEVTKEGIKINAKGDVNYRDQKVGSTGLVISKGSSILLNKTIQIELN